jgi:probable molybdopterin binding protein
MNKIVKVEEAVGLVLAHDVTEIRKGEFKGPAFKKGHKIRNSDICHLRRLGKAHIYALNIEDGSLHENDAAKILADAFCGPGVVRQGAPVEGKLKLTAETDGLLKVDVAALTRVNMLGDVMCACRHTNSVVKREEMVAATRAIPLVVGKAVVEQAAAISRAVGGLFRVKPFRSANIGIVITGSEVFSGLIEDRFEPILRRKIADIGSRVQDVLFAPDDAAVIASRIQELIQSGADFILSTGGMSVDPDDVTRTGIQRVCGSLNCYGAPVLPGSMLMIGYAEDIPILGVPACGIYHETTILDLILPRILAGEKLSREDVAQLGHGGLCLNCKECTYPICPFGKS